MGTTTFWRGAQFLAPVIVTALSTTPSFAETAKRTLAQVIEVSLQNNGGIKSFREEKGIRDSAQMRAGLLPNPTLDLEAGTGALTGSSGESSLAVGVSQELLLAGKRGKRLVVAEREMEIYRWQLADRERLLAEAVKTAFYDVILAEQRVALADRSAALNEQLLEVARERLAAGDIPELEMNLVRVELARSEGVRIEAEKGLNRYRSELGGLMGLLPDESPAVSGGFAGEISMTGQLAELKQLALGKRPDLRALAVERSRGEADVILAEAEGTPNITAGLVLRRESTVIETGGLEGKDTAYTIGLRLSMPIPLFDRNKAAVQEAVARKSISENRLLAAARSAEREVETAWAYLQNAKKGVSLYKMNIIPQLEENLQLTREAYRLGEVGILAVIAEQKKFFEVSDGYLLAQHDLQGAMVKLEAAVATDLGGGGQ